MSLFFSVVGMLFSYLFYSNGRKIASFCVFYFVLMEILQAFQYIFVADNLNSKQCGNFSNQFLTTMGYLHICFQPFVFNLGNSEYRNPQVREKFKERYVVILRLCFISGIYMFMNHILSLYTGMHRPEDGDWVVGETLCTYHGNHQECSVTPS